MPHGMVMTDLAGYLTKEQVDKLLETAKSMNDMYYLVILILWKTGCRVSELLEIETYMINKEESKIIIPTKKRRVKMQRIVPVEPWVIEEIERYVKKNRIKGRIFPYTRQYIFKIVRKCGKMAGIEKVGSKKIHPHHFRHSFSIFMVKNGLNIKILQQLLGHAKLSSTSFYIQFSEKEVTEKVMEIWEK